MMDIVLSTGTIAVAVVVVICSIFLFYWCSTRNHDYWKKRGVPSAKTYPFFGSLMDTFSEPLHDVEERRYKELGRIYGSGISHPATAVTLQERTRTSSYCGLSKAIVHTDTPQWPPHTSNSSNVQSATATSLALLQQSRSFSSGSFAQAAVASPKQQQSHAIKSGNVQTGMVASLKQWLYTSKRGNVHSATGTTSTQREKPRKVQQLSRSHSNTKHAHSSTVATLTFQQLSSSNISNTNSTTATLSLQQVSSSHSNKKQAHIATKATLTLQQSSSSPYSSGHFHSATVATLTLKQIPHLPGNTGHPQAKFDKHKHQQSHKNNGGNARAITASDKQRQSSTNKQPRTNNSDHKRHPRHKSNSGLAQAKIVGNKPTTPSSHNQQQPRSNSDHKHQPQHKSTSGLAQSKGVGNKPTTAGSHNQQKLSTNNSGDGQEKKSAHKHQRSHTNNSSQARGKGASQK